MPVLVSRRWAARVIATIVTNQGDLADLCWLVAVVLFAVACVLQVTVRTVSHAAAVAYAGLAFAALGWLVL